MIEDKTRVLSVDDNLQNRRIIELALKDHFDVISSDGNSPFIELVEETQPKVILLDIMLEGKTGFDLCSELRDSIDCSDIYVVFVSALTSVSDKLIAYASGGDDYICKPVNIEELQEKLKAIEKRISDKEQIAKQCTNASNIAFTSMKQASELGMLISFFNDSLEISTKEQLYTMIVDFFDQFDVKFSLEFRLENNIIQYPQNILPPLELEILELGRSGQRIVNFGNNILFNSKWCSILIKHISMDDESFVGRIRDNFAILLSIIDSRLMLMDSENKRITERKKALESLSEALSTNFSEIKQSILIQESKLLKVLSELTINLNHKSITMGLSEDQETELLGFFEETKDKFYDAIGASVSIDNNLQNINRILMKVN